MALEGTFHMTSRVAVTALVVLASGFTLAANPAAAQTGIGIGPRIAFIRTDSATSEGSNRFTGGVLRLGNAKTTLELALDYRSSLTGDLLEKVTDMPIQASLLVYPVRSALAPYLLGGIGWYSQNIKRFSAVGEASPVDDETTRRIGYHAGLGADLRIHRRLSLYGDYRYTFLHFGNDDDDVEDETPALIPFAERLKLSHEGSMFTWGAVLHF